jgi:diguanylate cyclase (GGDEF)-like protein
MDERAPGQRLLRSLPARIGTLVFLTTAAASLVVASVSLRLVQGFLADEMEQRFPRVLLTTSRQIDRWYAQREADLETFARSPALTEAMAQGRSDARSELSLELEGMLAQGSGYTGLLLLDAEGALVVRAGVPIDSHEAGRASASGRGPLRASTGPLRLDDDPGWQIVSVQVVDGHGRRRGSLHGRLELSLLEGLLHDRDLGPDSDLFLVDRGGQLVTPTRQGRPGDPLEPPLPALADGRVHQIRSAAGERLVICASALGRFGWTLIVKEPYSAAFAPAAAVLQRSLLIDVCVVALMSLLAFWAATWRVRPLRALANAARRISEGGVEVGIQPVETDDEIGVLTLAFNEMTDRVAEHRTLLERQRAEIEDANQRLQVQNDALHRMNETLGQLSITDGLTKLHNHRYFQDQLPKEVKRSQRTGVPLALILFDIDDFKKLNDSLGHAAGDAVLEHIAGVMLDAIRESDLLARYGGEEFALLAPQTDLKGALRLAEKLRGDVAESRPPVVGPHGQVQVSVSVGVAELRLGSRELFEDADRALYRAKQSGKDCVAS